MTKCISCERDTDSIVPVPEGAVTVCVGCLAVLVKESGVFRLATEAEASTQGAQRKLQMARLVRRLAPPEDVQ
jgi:hypothetical protein